MRPPRGWCAIGFRLLLAGVLLAMPSCVYADSRTATATAGGKAPSKSDASPERKAKSRAGSAPNRRVAGQAGGQSAARTVHIVRAGDTVSRLAAHYGVTRAALIDANHLARPDHLRIGQRLVVPGTEVAPAGGAVKLIDAAIENGSVLLVRAGPRRVPTRFHMASPEFDGQTAELAWPVDGRVISPFGKRRSSWHAGMDIKAEIGTPILAAAPGVVISSGQERAYGRIIRIEHENGFVTVYAHNLENLVEVGDRVTSGTIIATVGRTGGATSPHLHFEVRRDGMVYNPLHLLPARELIEMRADEAPDLPTESVRSQAVDDEVDE